MPSLPRGGILAGPFHFASRAREPATSTRLTHWALRLRAAADEMGLGKTLQMIALVLRDALSIRANPALYFARDRTFVCVWRHTDSLTPRHTPFPGCRRECAPRP